MDQFSQMQAEFRLKCSMILSFAGDEQTKPYILHTNARSRVSSHNQTPINSWLQWLARICPILVYQTLDESFENESTEWKQNCSQRKIISLSAMTNDVSTPRVDSQE